jgi:hypothetical protein
VSRFHYLPTLWDVTPDDEMTVRKATWTREEPLLPGERSAVHRDDYVPEQLSTADGAVAAWVATGETLRNPSLAFAVIRRAPDVDAFPARGASLDIDAARAAVRDLRAGKSVATSIVVRLACHMLETK